MRNLPVLEDLISSGDPSESNSHRILRIVTFLTLHLRDWNGIRVDDSITWVDIVEEEKISVFADVPRPHRKVKLDVQSVRE